MGHKYILNEDKLTFHQEELTLKDKLKTFSYYFVAGFAISLIVWGLFFTGVLKSPESLILEKQNKQLIADVVKVDSSFDSISNQLLSVQHRDDDFYRVISELSPISQSVRQAGFGGTDRYGYLDGYQNSNLLIESAQKGDILLKQLHIQSESYDTVISLVRVKQDSLLSIPAIMPLSPTDFRRVSDPFGMRIHPITKKRRMHTGIDLAASIGKSIHAAGNGVVVDVRRTKTGYGKYVVIDHGYGFKTLYGHMSKIIVKKGDVVKRGQQIGMVGNTGRSTGPHLHYEVMYHNKKKNPKYYYINDLTDSEYKNMIHLFSGQDS